ncbi:MAG TPA: rod shape-determining protein MreC [Gemmatimonadales bacterium]
MGADRYASRADTLIFVGCLALSFAAMSVPDTVREPMGRVLRQTVLAPFLALQEASEELRTSRARFDAVAAQRDSATLEAAFLPELRRENDRLRSLLSLGQRLSWGYAPAELLHQAEPTNALTVVVSAGRNRGIQPLSGVVSPEGLVGVVQSVDARTSIVLTWAHPDFRASAMAEDGSVFGIVAPHGAAGPGVWLLELGGVAYRRVVPEGTRILTSGLGGVLPRGIPLGTVIGVASEAEGWERTYLVRPAVHPAAVSHVMVLTASRADIRNAFETGNAREDRR